MTATGRSEAVEAAVAAGEPVGRPYLLALDARIRAFESRYELPTPDLLATLEAGRIQETAEICEWLFLASLRSRLGEARAEPKK